MGAPTAGMMVPRWPGVWLLWLATAVCSASGLADPAASAAHTSSFAVVRGKATGTVEVRAGRVLVFMSRSLKGGDPISQCSDDQSTSQVFGKTVSAFLPDSTVRLPGDTIGYPVETIDALPPGEYWVQAQLLRYDEYQREVGPNVILPVSCVNAGGSDGSYGAPPGTFFSKPSKLMWGNVSNTVELELSEVVPPAQSPGCAGGGRENSEYVRTHRMVSPSLSKWWGREITLEACVLLPWGWDDHPTAKYPVIVSHGHYSATWWTGGAFSETPPPANLTGYDKVQAEAAYELYKQWISPTGVFKNNRAMVVQINHPNPFFDDSYAVNSANLGPYGDAITHELIPDVERVYRGVGAGWARGLFGGSTGGWESLAVQVLYPDEYNGAHAACPDPITFTSYTTIDIYSDTNAFFYDAPFKRTERPGMRDHYSGQTVGYGHPYGQTTATVREMNRRELVLGENSRSCGQWDIWEAVFGPMGSKGYPERLFDKLTGEINQTTALYWREHFDLKYILQRDRATLVPKLKNKMHIYVGGSDTFFLTNAVMDMQDFLERNGSAYNATTLIGTHNGRGFEHCFNGYGEVAGDRRPLPNSITRLHYNTKFVPELCTHFRDTAPPGADLSWVY